MRKKCPYSEFFWSIFSPNAGKYGQSNSEYGHFSRSANPVTSSKMYWSILKTSLNNRKSSFIPPLFHENKFIPNFKEKDELFNTFFASQYTFLNNSSVLHNNLANLTNKSLDSINFSTDDISKIINNLDLNKAHSDNMLGIRMIKLCANSICKPLSIIFYDCLKEGKFPSHWKKAHVVSIHKNGDKPCLKNYRPICLLLIRSRLSFIMFLDISKVFNKVFQNMP